jgi:sarcosine oxidase subunit gamma
MADVVPRIPFAFVETPWLRAVPAVARFVFRGDQAARAAAATPFGTDLPAGVGRAITHRARAALALGPDEHWLIVPEDEASVFAREMAAALAGLAHSLVDISHRQVAVELRGADAEWLLSGGCPLPLDRDAFPVDACTRTVFGKAEVTLWRTREDVFRIEVARSYAGYLVALLREVARELPADRGDT